MSKDWSVIPFSSVTDCEDCPFSRDEYSRFCKDDSAPCTWDKYKTLSCEEVVDELESSESAYLDYLAREEELAEIEFYKKMERQEKAQKRKRVTHLYDIRIRSLKSKIHKTEVAESRLLSLGRAFSIAGSIMNGGDIPEEKPKVKSEVITKLEEELADVQRRRKIALEKYRAEEKAKADAKKREKIAHIFDNLPEPTFVEAIVYNNSIAGFSISYPADIVVCMSKNLNTSVRINKREHLNVDIGVSAFTVSEIDYLQARLTVYNTLNAKVVKDRLVTEKELKNKCYNLAIPEKLEYKFKDAVLSYLR
jgi:hypothetical protein